MMKIENLSFIKKVLRFKDDFFLSQAILSLEKKKCFRPFIDSPCEKKQERSSFIGTKIIG